MRLLYHFWLSPACRKIRLVLQEKGLDFTMKVEKAWERRPEFLALNPAGSLPRQGISSYSSDQSGRRHQFGDLPAVEPGGIDRRRLEARERRQGRIGLRAGAHRVLV